MTDLSDIRKTVHVPVPPETAFELFTDRLADWWPVESHSIAANSGDRPASVEVTPGEGGPITEELPDGQTVRWGHVTDWEPGRRLGLSWYVGRTEDEATEITVVFTPSEGGTRVDLTHGGWQRLADQASAIRKGYHSGWDHVLGTCFGGYCQAAALPHAAE